MRRPPGWLVVAGIVLVGGGGGPATGAGFPDDVGAFARGEAERPMSVAELAAAIDRHLAAGWASAGVGPAAVADDAEFLRRVSLDVAGRIPTSADVRAFLDDPTPSDEKRRRVVDRLLAEPGYARHMAGQWKAWLTPEISAGDFQKSLFAGEFETWLRRQFAEGVTYDKLATTLLTADSNTNVTRFYNGGDQAPAGPSGFYAAKDNKPEELAAASARVFLGVRLECAQCHDHPFSDWKREQFWSYAAFFAATPTRNGGGGLLGALTDPGKHELEIPGTGKKVQAAFLDGSAPVVPWRTSARQPLVQWMTRAENAYFSRAAVNRVWSLFFGVGFVDPVDDLDEVNPPSHPELLDLLARQFAANRFDLKVLIRAITASRAYQATSAGYEPGADDPRLFARMPVRGLSALQFYDSFVVATGINREDDLPSFVFGGESPRKDFLERFAAAADERPYEAGRSILQALTLMNGRFTADATRESATLTAIREAPFLDMPSKIEALYFATLGRAPRPHEAERMLAYVERGGTTGKESDALADVFWALLNSAEFSHNH